MHTSRSRRLHQTENLLLLLEYFGGLAQFHLGQLLWWSQPQQATLSIFEGTHRQGLNVWAQVKGNTIPGDYSITLYHFFIRGIQDRIGPLAFPDSEGRLVRSSPFQEKIAGPHQINPRAREQVLCASAQWDIRRPGSLTKPTSFVRLGVRQVFETATRTSFTGQTHDEEYVAPFCFEHGIREHLEGSAQATLLLGHIYTHVQAMMEVITL